MPPNHCIKGDGKKPPRHMLAAQAMYEIVDANTIVGGITFEEQKVYDNAGKANFMPTSTQGVFIPLPSVQDWPDEYLWPAEKRDFRAAYAEDIWDIMDDLRLTIV